MMADFVTPRRSEVMERLRRRIEHFRQHHNSCEERYMTAMVERQELDRQQTYALHQRCLQSKAKRSSKHRQSQPSSDQAGQRAPGGGGGGAGGGPEHAESGGTAAEQSRNSTLMVLQEAVKRKLESASSPLGRDPVNGYSDSFPPSQKACLENGSPIDSKLDISNSHNSNGTHGSVGESVDGGGEPGSDFQLKEMKQEPDDILPIMPPSGGGNNSLFPDLNLNDQEWTELMEELNFPVDYEDIQDILNDGFEDRKDPLELAATPGGGGGMGGGVGGGGGQSSQGLIPPELVSVKAEFSPAPAVFEQESRTGSPHVRSTPSGAPPHPTNSPVASSSGSSPAVAPSQPAPPRQIQPPPNHLLPPKDLSPAQQLQQLAAQQQRAQHLHGQMQHKPQQPGAKFHNQGAHPHPPPWSQMANTSQSPLGGAFGMDKSTSPSLYSQDFNPNTQKQLLMPSQPNKGSPKAGAGSYMPGSAAGHPSMLSHTTSGPPLSHPPATGAQAPTNMLNYNNTKPLSHYEVGPGPQRPPNTQNQKAALLTLLQQQQQHQQQQRLKPKSNMTNPHYIPHSQDQNKYPAPPHGPGPASAMSSTPGNNAMAGNHGNAAYLNSSAAVAAVRKQQQQQQFMQRQQQMAEQEKQRQQDQQLQRHLTRPPPQYQDQTGVPANQNPYPQQPGNQFTASSQPMGSVSSMGGPAPGSRMFPQNQGMMGMNMGQGGGPASGVAPSPAVSQADISLPSCGGGGGGAGVDVLYSNINMHPNHTAHPPQQAGLQRQSLGAMSAPFRHNLLAQQQQHLKPPPNAAMLKQQQMARMPGSMQGNMGANLPTSMPGGMPGGQSAGWQQQLANQPPSSNAGLPPNAFSNSNAFHMQQQQPRIPKMPPGPAPFSANPSGRPMGGLNPGQQMMQTNMAAAQQRALPNPQSLGQPMANQQQAQQPQAPQNLPELSAFGQQQGNGRQALQCNQGYQVSRTANQQQQVSFGYNAASGSFAAESELVDSLLKSQSTQEWMADLDELLASHH